MSYVSTTSEDRGQLPCSREEYRLPEQEDALMDGMNDAAVSAARHRASTDATDVELLRAD
jgi:hypothetical protein